MGFLRLLELYMVTMSETSRAQFNDHEGKVTGKEERDCNLATIQVTNQTHQNIFCKETQKKERTFW